MLLSFPDNKEVNNAGGEVKRNMSLAVDDGDTVPVPIAGTGHPPAEDQERRPAE